MNKRIFLTVLAFSMFAITSAYAQTYNEQIDISAIGKRCQQNKHRAGKIQDKD